ncbi:hypothetical protein [Pelagibacterium mangrovi]|uniref:hypothetical protein n=1 Tax=Pelagibacterium mangrovi TaxID=3119828 RepID=UPI002FCA834A
MTNLHPAFGTPDQEKQDCFGKFPEGVDYSDTFGLRIPIATREAKRIRRKNLSHGGFRVYHKLFKSTGYSWYCSWAAKQLEKEF